MKNFFLGITCALFAMSIISCDDDKEVVIVEKPVEPVRVIDSTYDPIIDPENFVAGVTNQYFPLTPGVVLIYEGETEDGLETITVTVTNETKVILGVTCIVVNDVVEIDGEAVEDTDDWYAQDADGNVWYFGEDSEELEDGEVVSTEGSWEAGVDGAKPGIIMPASPILGIPYRQEYFFNVAEDWGKAVEIGVTVTTPFDTFTDCLQTEDWNALEPGVVENKFYAPGVGVVKEESDEEVVELVDVQ